ncbi:hypothetical protein FIV42_24055 [Persicimonas caeni]|uniref:Co-chaperone DjlA N-terminal domain-containing protein n=1 Tax=Persicimonas caeni TaxID=2292766 RepID=A0A4Y6Q145_PERCE|nr:TerB family tellurite resistance protein [Persicimonas caeni]QDG53705.1 hypothetical protein FIV42_24055 [Persicimonas caeni]QED34926.1 hypothetical protein FRD00_24050 [Persicimonas caeni]
MFTYHLSYEEKEALLKLVGFLAQSDQDVSPEERKFVLDLAHDLNVSSEGAFDDLDGQNLESLCDAFQRDSAKRVAIVELVDLALADHEYFAEEKAAVRDVAEVMGISDDEVAKIEDWVARGQKWHEEGHRLLGLVGDQKVDV